MIGETISHYKILEKIGEGGMGVVYKAQDTKLDRLVAIKFLPEHFSLKEDQKRRFIHEAKAAAALDHNNICSVHDFGETDDGQMYMVMPCYQGQNLKDKIASRPSPINEAIDTVIQIAEGLNKAHKKNIVHRDIKSANIFITDEGVAKILDFGVAKLKGRTKLTKEDSTLGTIDYMSPEQAEGSKVDHRSDIWSLGVVLYEMITGQLPFRGDYEHAIVYSIMNEQPEAITGLRSGIPLELELIINKMLAKDPAERYQGISDLLVDLKSVKKQFLSKVLEKISLRRPLFKRWYVYFSLGALIVAFSLFILVFYPDSHKSFDSIAVLPLKNLSGNPAQEYFVDGMTDTLINELAKISKLKVISRHSIMLYKGQNKPLPQIARELDVEAVLEGSVFRSGQKLRIIVQLIEATEDRHIWAQDYERNIDDVFKLQKEIAQAIAGEINVKLTHQEKKLLVSDTLVNSQALDLYLKADEQYWIYTAQSFEKAKQYLEKAINIDPNFAKSYELLSGIYGELHFVAGTPTKESFPTSKKFARKALELDPTLAEAYAVLAWSLAAYDWDWKTAEQNFKKALQLEPGNSDIHNAYGFFLSWMGRFDQAIQEMKRAVELNPISLSGWIQLSVVHTLARRFDQAIEIAKRSLNMDPKKHHLAYFRLGQAYEGKGMLKEAIAAYEKAVERSGGVLLWKTKLGHAYGLAGQKEKANQIIKEFLEYSVKEYIPSHYIAVVYLGLGEKDKAIQYLERSYNERDGDLVLLKVGYTWDPLRNDPRFQAILKRMNFPD